MATKFADLGKGPKDLLVEDYTSSFVLRAKKMAGPVAVTIETERVAGGVLASKVGTKFSYDKFNVDKGQLKPDGGRVLETSLILAPHLKMSFKANKGADLGIDYMKGNFYGTAVLDVMDMSRVTSSACLGLSSGFKLGGEATYNLNGINGLAGFNVGASYTVGPMFAAVTASNKQQVDVGLLYLVNKDLALASQTTHSANKACDVLAVGGALKAPSGIIKAK
jgi:voltage-dependent anion channel protein 2